MRTRFGRVSAVCLIVLGLSPFTAPFSTCDFSTLFADSTPRGSVVLVPPLLPSASLVDDVVCGIATAIFAVPSPFVSIARHAVFGSQVSHPPLLQAVLRV